MKQIMFYIFLAICCLCIKNVHSLQNEGIENLWKITSPTIASVQENAVKELIRRLLPQRVNEFEVIINTELLNSDFKDKFILESVDNKTRITATSGVSAANGFNYYLKYFANCHTSWSGDQLNVAQPLPIIKTPVRIVIQDKFRYYQNVCTASYSMVWWDFKRWEREIDWMAMRAINFPLAFNGQELVWRKVFEKFGFNDTEIDDYFSGPAFLAWNRMGNFQGWSGPLTDNWHKYQSQLQFQILQRMREFGMIPILPAFAGHVPKNFTRVFPEARVSKLSDWGKFNQSFCCTTFLNPNDSRFELIGVTFINEYKNMYGTDHFYNTDLFNEMTPSSKEPQFLSDCGKAVYQSLVKSDPKAIWIMQGWLFHNDPDFWHKEQAKALITSVPQGKLLILDLFSELYPMYEELDGYYGQPFIWCMLHNFGGALGLYGAFNRINSENLFATRVNYTNMVGIGLTPEGIEQNDIIYEFMTETTWFTSAIDLDDWVTKYAIRRYGVRNEDVVKAWNLLQNSVYTDPIKVRNHGQYVFIQRPSLKLVSPIWYNANDVVNAHLLFVNASHDQRIGNIETFRYDLVDITRQFWQILFDTYYNELISSYNRANQSDFALWSQSMIDLLDNLDTLLASNEHFSLTKWIESAKSLAISDEERVYNENQARNQITIWGPNGNILDYATKQWSGMVCNYYKPRWQLFIKYLQQSLTDKSTFNQTKFNEEVFNSVELKFVNSRNSSCFDREPTGDSVAIVRNLFENYAKQDVYISQENIVYHSGKAEW